MAQDQAERCDGCATLLHPECRRGLGRCPTLGCAESVVRVAPPVAEEPVRRRDRRGFAFGVALLLAILCAVVLVPRDDRAGPAPVAVPRVEAPGSVEAPGPVEPPRPVERPVPVVSRPAPAEALALIEAGDLAGLQRLARSGHDVRAAVPGLVRRLALDHARRLEAGTVLLEVAPQEPGALRALITSQLEVLRTGTGVRPAAAARQLARAALLLDDAVLTAEVERALADALERRVELASLVEDARARLAARR